MDSYECSMSLGRPASSPQVGFMPLYGQMLLDKEAVAVVRQELCTDE